MVNHLRPVNADFLSEAHVRLVFEHRMLSSPEDVFRELTEDASTWPLWFFAVRTAGYTGPPPYGPGAGRAVTLRGGVRFVEQVIVWEEPKRFVYRVEQANVPGVHAWLEEWLLTPGADGGSELRFTMAVDGNPAVQALMQAIRPAMGRSIRRAFVSLDAHAKRLG